MRHVVIGIAYEADLEIRQAPSFLEDGQQISQDLAGVLVIRECVDHGHCGVLGPDGAVLNDPTLELYQRIASVPSAFTASEG